MASPTSGPTNLGMDPKIANLLCYVPCCVGFIFSLVAAVVEKTNRSIRFNAFQSLLLHAAAIVVGIGLLILQALLAMIGLGVVGSLLGILQMVAGVALLAVLIILMIKANSGQEFPLPVIGDMARKWV